MKALLVTAAGVVLAWTYDIDLIEKWQKACKNCDYHVEFIM